MFELRLESVGSLHQPAALATSVGGKAFVDLPKATAEMVEKQYPVGQRAQLPRHFAEQVVLEAVRLIGAAYECRVQLQDGTPDEAIRTLEEVVGLMQTRVEGAPRIQLGDPEKLRLLLESAYIRLVYAHDRQFAVSLSGIRTLPHQIEAVYRKMLPQPRLRFLLADDPGAGKTNFFAGSESPSRSYSRRLTSNSLSILASGLHRSSPPSTTRNKRMFVRECSSGGGI